MIQCKLIRLRISVRWFIVFGISNTELYTYIYAQHRFSVSAEHMLHPRMFRIDFTFRAFSVNHLHGFRLFGKI